VRAARGHARAGVAQKLLHGAQVAGVQLVQCPGIGWAVGQVIVFRGLPLYRFRRRRKAIVRATKRMMQLVQSIPGHYASLSAGTVRRNRYRRIGGDPPRLDAIRRL
jgi:hypothetical protein